MAGAARVDAANDVGPEPSRAPPDAAAIAVEVHDDAGAFERLGPEWNALSESAGNACAFLDLEWHRTWWAVYARPADRLHLVAFRLDGELVGLLPLYARRLAGPVGPARLRFVGTGETRGEEVVTEYADALARDDAARAVGDVALAHLTRFARWRSVELRCLLEGSVLLDALRRHEPAHALVRDAGRRYRVDLAGGEAAHFARLGPGRVRRIERSRRAVARDGGFERVSPVRPEDVDAAFETLARLHENRQRRLGRRRGAFAAERFARFHRTLVHALLPGGAADVEVWRIGGEPVAALHLYARGETLHYYQSGFAGRGANRWMPLTLAHLERMASAREAGVRWYDLMRGESPCYKDDFGCETTPMHTALLFASGAGLRLEAWRRAASAHARRTLARLGLREP